VGKGDRFVDITQSPDSQNNWRLATEELVERGEAMARMIAYAVAKEAFDALLDEIPGGSDYDELRKALKLSEVGGPKKGKEAAFAIHIPTKGRRIKKIDVAKTVIFVHAKKSLNRPAEDVQLLEDSGPWTADTIPFWPTDSEALIVQRKVTKREADKVAKGQKLKLPKLIHQFKEMGRSIKPVKPGSPGRIKRNAKAVPDLAMQALNLEFGGGDTKSKPVFRKVFRGIKQSIHGLADRFDEIKDAMTDPNSKKYKNWPKRMDKITSGEAATFKGFQKRLGF
jgi:hypothetical protein